LIESFVTPLPSVLTTLKVVVLFDGDYVLPGLAVLVPLPHALSTSAIASAPAPAAVRRIFRRRYRLVH